MTQQINFQAASRRERSRQPDGKFGAQEHSEADVNLGDSLAAQHHRQNNRRLEDAQFDGYVEAAWVTVDDDDQYQLNVAIAQDLSAAVPPEYSSANRHSAASIHQYLNDRQHVIERAMGDFYGSEVSALESGDTSVRYEVVKDLDGPVTNDEAYNLIDQEFEPHNPYVHTDLSRHIAQRLSEYDAQKLPNPDVLNESNQRQFADRVIESLHRDAQVSFDDQAVHEEKVRLDIVDQERLRAALHNVYAENAGDIESYDESTGRNPAHEAYYAAAGHAEDLESTVTGLSARVIGRRLERSFVAEMPKLDTSSGQVEIEDDGLVHIHPQVFDDFAQQRAQRISQDTQDR